MIPRIRLLIFAAPLLFSSMLGFTSCSKSTDYARSASSEQVVTAGAKVAENAAIKVEEIGDAMDNQLSKDLTITGTIVESNHSNPGELKIDLGDGTAMVVNTEGLSLPASNKADWIGKNLVATGTASIDTSVFTNTPKGDYTEPELEDSHPDTYSEHAITANAVRFKAKGIVIR